MLLRLKKEIARVRDLLTLEGGVSSPGSGIRMPDGAPVPVEKIMKEFGVDRQRAEQIAKRASE